MRVESFTVRVELRLMDTKCRDNALVCGLWVFTVHVNRCLKNTPDVSLIAIYIVHLYIVQSAMYISMSFSIEIYKLHFI